MDVMLVVERDFERALRDAYRNFNRLLEERIKQHGVSIGQWQYLCILWERQGLSQFELSQLAGTRAPTTATTVQGMEHAGLVRRERDPDDIRRMKVFLTERGENLKKELETSACDVIELASEGLEESELLGVKLGLMKLATNLRNENRK